MAWITPQQYQRMLTLRSKGLSISAISRKIGKAEQTVSRRLSGRHHSFRREPEGKAKYSKELGYQRLRDISIETGNPIEDLDEYIAVVIDLAKAKQNGNNSNQGH